MKLSSTHELAPWRLQDAKARFSELVRRAGTDGPQHVSGRGRRAAVILSNEDHEQLTDAEPSIVDFILDGEPWSDDVFEAINDRDRVLDREVAL